MEVTENRFVIGDVIIKTTAEFIEKVARNQSSEDTSSFMGEHSLELGLFIDRIYSADNERLATAAAFVDSAIRSGEPLIVFGKYLEGFVATEFLRVGRCGFLFDNYELPSAKTPPMPT